MNAPRNRYKAHAPNRRRRPARGAHWWTAVALLGLLNLTPLRPRRVGWLFWPMIFSSILWAVMFLAGAGLWTVLHRMGAP